MKELETKLKELQKLGYEFIDIGQVLQLMYDIQKENRLKKSNMLRNRKNGRR